MPFQIATTASPASMPVLPCANRHHSTSVPFERQSGKCRLSAIPEPPPTPEKHFCQSIVPGVSRSFGPGPEAWHMVALIAPSRESRRREGIKCAMKCLE
jgi:hypothetical protein